MKILIIDNYDSFTFNLVRMVRDIAGVAPVVKRNDAFTSEEVRGYDKILLSPGPGIPSEAGKLLSLIREFAAEKSILGVCLGHQAIAEAFGARLLRLDQVCHGVATPISISGNDPLFANMAGTIDVGRYHSWVVQHEGLPEELEVLSEDDQGHIMALRHRHYRVYGLQFHPESIMTPDGAQIISNWIND